MYLKDIVIGVFEKRNSYQLKFNKETWCITALYFSCLGKFYETGKFKKAVVNAITDIGMDGKIDRRGNVIIINRYFDFNAYFQLANHQRKQMLLTALYEGLKIIANSESWPIDPLIDAWDCCIKRDLTYEWIVNDKYFQSPDKNTFAGVFCHWDLDKFEAFVIFFNKKKEELKRLKLFEAEPHLVEPLGKIGWDKETNEFIIYSKDKKNKWIASTNS